VKGRAAGRVRIVAGARRGRLIRVPQTGEVRPTSEKIREAVFSALGPVSGLTVLDLFAGTGAMGLEALSRGAANCVFVENDRSVAAVLRENISTLQYGADCTVIVSDYAAALEVMMQSARRFDLLFVDPPYRMLQEVEVLLAPLLAFLLAPGGVAVIEGARSSEARFGRSPVFERVYGETKIMMLKNQEE
jgi:16S rRNA (guanine966-N2)-methyltransferase